MPDTYLEIRGGGGGGWRSPQIFFSSFVPKFGLKTGGRAGLPGPATGKQSLFFFSKLLHASLFAVTLVGIRNGRIISEKADCKKSNFLLSL